MPLRIVMVLILLGAGAGRYAAAQIPLYLANDETTVRAISFTFADAERHPPQFTDEVLRAQIATQAPRLADRIKRTLGVGTTAPFLLNPIELQKDVVRLRTFYRQNGYLSPYVDYGASRLDTTNNTIHIVLDIEQGPPIIIQDVAFFGPDGRQYLANRFEGTVRDQWIRFRDRTSFKTGDRFTDFDLVRIQDQVLGWLKDQGYAFATLDTETLIDSTFSTADISFNVDPGPLGYFDEIQIEGNEKVSDQVVRRELPFKRGDVFSQRKLIQGQRELFGLNLFQIAQIDVPGAVEPPATPGPNQQRRDSTVAVRITLRESKLRFVTAQTGYDQEKGITLDGQWSHRNFLGGGRTLSVLGEIDSGVLASSALGGAPDRLFRASIPLQQPYLFTNGLNAIIEPFIQYERDPLLRDTDLPLDLNRREFGLNTTLIYELQSFRTISLQYSLSRATQFTDDRPDTTSTRDVYSKSIITLSGTLGRTNNFLNPRRGFLVRPFLEQGGALEKLIGLGASGVEYFKTGIEIIGYIPITRRISVGTRLAGGRVWLRGQSNDPFPVFPAGAAEPVFFDRHFVAPFENRFDRVRFYAGGSNDVRGWDFGLIGPKINLTECAEESQCVRDDNGVLVAQGTLQDGLPLTTTERYEPLGGLARLVGNVEVRLPFPGLGNAWRTAVFLDFGQVSGEVDEAQACTPPFTAEEDGVRVPIDVQCGFRDTGSLSISNFKFGAGGGIRYETPIGYIRLDVAFKLNPDDLDLQTPRSAFLDAEGFEAAERSFLQRLNIHLSIGQAF